MANRIYRGPVEACPLQLEGLTAGAYLPGTWVTYDGTNLTAAAGAEGRPLPLGNREFFQADETADVFAAYASGDTGIAYRARPEDEFYLRFDAGTYTRGQELTISANGRLAAAASTNLVVAYFDQAGATLTNGDFADVVIANAYVKA